MFSSDLRAWTTIRWSAVNDKPEAFGVAEPVDRMCLPFTRKSARLPRRKTENGVRERGRGKIKRELSPERHASARRLQLRCPTTVAAFTVIRTLLSGRWAYPRSNDAARALLYFVGGFPRHLSKTCDFRLHTRHAYRVSPVAVARRYPTLKTYLDKNGHVEHG